MKHSFLALPLLFVAQGLCEMSVHAQARVPLPYQAVGTLDGARFRIRVPENWNGTLLVYLLGTKAATVTETAVVPPVPAGSQPALEDALLARGYALASSDVATQDMQAKEEAQDSLTLTAYFRGAVGDPKRILLWGTSLGAMVSLKMIEDYPRTYDAAIATCPPAAGFPRAFDRHLDFSVAYAAAFGWPEDKWGPVGDLRDGLNFMTDILPAANTPKADGSNRGGWEFVRLVNGIGAEAFWNTNPVYTQPGWVINLFMATATRALNEAYAAGPYAQNLDHQYSLTAAEKDYLAGLGVNPNALLDRMNAMRVAAAPHSRDYIERFGALRGLLQRPVLMLHNTSDNVADVRNQSAYQAQAEWWSAGGQLAHAYVKSPGHCVFSPAQLLAALDAIEGWLATGSPPAPAAFPEALGFDNAFQPARWPY